MKHLFVDKQIAIELKDLGFDEPCFCVYNPSVDGIFMSNSNDLDGQPRNSDLTSGVSIALPIYQQVIEWFIKEHDLVIIVEYIGHLDDIPKFEGTIVGDFGETELSEGGKYFSYRNALLDGIYGAIKELKRLNSLKDKDEIRID